MNHSCEQVKVFIFQVLYQTGAIIISSTIFEDLNENILLSHSSLRLRVPIT